MQKAISRATNIRKTMGRQRRIKIPIKSSKTINGIATINSSFRSAKSATKKIPIITARYIRIDIKKAPFGTPRTLLKYKERPCGRE